jgi:RimJ/RimL family protein N-acetyltransferase
MKQDLRAVGFRSPRLTLQSFVLRDAPLIFPFATAEIAKFMSWEPAHSLAAFVEIAREWLPLMESGTDLSLVLRQFDTGDFAGVVGLHGLDCPEPEIGIWIRGDSHRRGYGSEAIAATMAWASAQFGIMAVRYPVVVDNRPSRQLAEHLGGTLVGTRELKKASGVILPEVVYRIPTAVCGG